MHGWTMGSLRVLPVAGLLAAGLAVSPAASAAAHTSGTWARTGSMTAPREAQTAILLRNGQVLVAGGDEGGAATSSAELYNPATGKFSPTGGMGAVRGGFTATLLQNGQVLAAGGEGTCVNGSCPILASAELYNPATGTWTPTGSMSGDRAIHTATLLPNGQVLVAGGVSSTIAPLSSAELYNPDTGTFSPTGSMTTGLSRQMAGLLPTGQVLVVCHTFPPCQAELYNPATGTWAADGQADPSASRNFSATLLDNGQVLFSGGENGVFPGKTTVTAAATLFDPATGTFAVTGSMTIPRTIHSLTVLQNGQVLATGGETQNNVGKTSITATAELFTQ